MLRDVRRLAVRDLIRRNKAVIQADHNGAAIVRGEILAVSPGQAAIDAATAAGFTVLRTRILEGLDAQIVVLAVPAGMDTLRALERVRALAPATRFDFNHVYTSSGVVVGGGAAVDIEGHVAVEPRAGSEAGVAVDAGTTVATRIGLIDGGVDSAHPVFAGTSIHQHGCPSGPVPDTHGTAVASLLIGRSVDFRGSAPGAELYAADVYCGLPTGGAADAVADAFSWLAREHVPVINVSLVGPPNVTLETVIRLVIARGHLVVAAVGNDGPAARPLYPASYPGVVGVTAVDAHRRALFEAGRGPQVRFAAPGADMTAAKSVQTFELVRGTSFAAPIVAGLLAARLPTPDPTAAQRAVDSLAREAVDLGAAGPDPVYGAGLVGVGLAPEARLAGQRRR
ncbi:MAG: S8 family serine peptidase [Proteobacteria bacterium]|nr:S8 family serine peptidase [Pseudomonadota bacterium]